VPHGVGSDSLGDARSAGDATHDAAGSVAVEVGAVVPCEDRTLVAFAYGEVHGAGGAGCEWDGGDLAALAPDGQRAMAAFKPEPFDVGANRFGYAQSVEREEGEEVVVTGTGESGGNEHGADLIAVQGGGVRLAVEAGTPDVHGW
jgi:hypothetical protein